jgi:inner membrane protein
MDSLTQFALGAAIGVAVIRGKTPFWKSMLIGGAIATLPDLDAFIDHGDPVRNMTFHRGESHAYFYQTLASPVIAWVVTRFSSQRQYFIPWLIATWLILITHATLDLMTVYGTQIGLPFFTGAYGISSIFIIDPLYTLPLIFGLITTGVAKSDTRFKWNNIGLVISTLYLVWSMGAQGYVLDLAKTSLAEKNILSEKILVTPTAFNTILWRVLVMTDNGYEEGFYSLLDKDRTIDFSHYSNDIDTYTDWKDDWNVRRMEWFTRGFFKMEMVEGQPVLSDLRMGQEPHYTFNFTLSSESAPEHHRSRPDISLTLEWVKERALGKKMGLQEFLKAHSNQE